MSRIGKKSIPIPAGVKVNVANNQALVEGEKGKLAFTIPQRIICEVKENQVFVKSGSRNRLDKSLHGLTRSVIANMIKGVSEGYAKELEIQGVGFRAAVQANGLSLILGFSHPVTFNIPSDVKIETPKPTSIVVKGIDKQRVGEIAAQIRKIYPPEPYKGKGIRYLGEVVRKKAGKAAAK
jgi:large subunit ribosomal protein L6